MKFYWLYHQLMGHRSMGHWPMSHWPVVCSSDINWKLYMDRSTCWEDCWDIVIHAQIGSNVFTVKKFVRIIHDRPMRSFKFELQKPLRFAVIGLVVVYVTVMVTCDRTWKDRLTLLWVTILKQCIVKIYFQFLKMSDLTCVFLLIIYLLSD